MYTSIYTSNRPGINADVQVSTLSLSIYIYIYMYIYIIQIKICAEYRDMLPRPRLVCQEPGLRPIPGHATQAKAGLSGTWAEADRPKPRCT